VVIAAMVPLFLQLAAPAMSAEGPALLMPTGEQEVATLATGRQLFEAHCVGCHVQGGNIVRRDRTLHLAALQRYGFADPEAIATIAADGLGRMSGYAEALGDDGPRAVAAWVWQQALSDWPRG